MRPGSSTSKMLSGSEGQQRCRRWGILWPVVQWGLVLYLLWPLHRRVQGMWDFARVALGIFFFVIFAGKLLYDQVVTRQSGTEPREQLLHLLGIVVGLVVIVAAVIFLLGALVANLFVASQAER